MSHCYTDIHTPKASETRLREQIAITEAQKKFWQAEAERLTDAIEMIPRALEEYGECSITDSRGRPWYLALDPKRHNGDPT